MLGFTPDDIVRFYLEWNLEIQLGVVYKEVFVSKTRPKRNRLLTAVIVVWVVVCLILLGVLGLFFTGNLPFVPSGLMDPGAMGAGIAIESPAPDFSLQTITGETIKLSDLKGKPVVINFWATWCGPCVREMPALQKYQTKHPEMVVLGLDEEESVEVVKEFVDKMKFTYQILMDEKAEVSALYQVMIMPTSYFIDETGMVRARHFGYMGEEQLKFYLGTIGVIE